MTQTQFEFIALMARLKPASKSREAARLYLLENKNQPAIAKELGIAQPTVSQAIIRFKKAWNLAKHIQ